MSFSRRARLAGASLLALIAVAGTASAETLQDAIALAYQTNPNLQQQRANQRATDEGVVQARAGLRPDVSVSSGLSYSSGSVPTGAPGVFVNTTNRQASGDVSVNQPLYNGGRTARAVEAAQSDVLAGRERLRAVEGDVLRNVVQSYTDVRRDQEQLRIRQENVVVLRRQLEESNARFEVGEITRTDVAQSEARLAQAEAALSQAQAQLSVSRAAYAATVGQVPTNLAPEPDLPGVPATFEAAMDVAEDSNPDLLAAVYQEEAARARLAQARAAYLPTVGLSASYGAGTQLGRDWGFQGQFVDQDRFQAQGQISVPLFTGGLNGSRVRQSLEQVNAAQIAVEGQRREVLRAVSQSWATLVSARAAVTANEEAVRAQRIAAEGVRQEAQVGLRTTLDVLDAERELREAELTLVRTRADAYVASADLLNAMGLLEARNLTPGVQVYDPAANLRRVSNRGTVLYDEALIALDGIASPQRPASRDSAADAPIDVQLKQGGRPNTQVPVTQPTVNATTPPPPPGSR